MMLMLLPAPFLIGALVKWGVPFIDILTTQYFGFSLAPWYGMIDGFMLALIPATLSILSAFLLLDERDEGTGAYYQITPVQGYAYLLARIGLPTVWTLLCNIVIGIFFHISNLAIMDTIFVGIIGTGAGIACAMMIVSLAENRVEGLAISKLIGASLLGALVAGVIPAPYQYIAAFLPSFWIGMITHYGTSFVVVIGGLLVCVLWILFFVKKFMRRI